MRKYVRALSTDRAIHARAAVGAEYWPTQAPAPVGAWPPQQGPQLRVSAIPQDQRSGPHPSRIVPRPAACMGCPGADIGATARMARADPVTPLPRYPRHRVWIRRTVRNRRQIQSMSCSRGLVLGSLDPLFDSGQVALVLCTREQAQCGRIDIESNRHSDPHLRSPLPCSYAGFLNCCLDVARG